jgi:hypothetical protein
MAVLLSYCAARHYHLSLSYSAITTRQDVLFTEIMALGFTRKETKNF